MSIRNVPCSAAIAVAIATVLIAAAAAPAAAQSATGAAEALFRDGKRLMAAGKIAEACTAFEGSYKKEPTISTLLNLADCREKNGQFASAWGHFIDAMRRTRGDAAQASLFNTAKDRSARLEPRLSYLIINVPDEARVEGLEITRNGVVVDATEWNRDMPVDGGEYKIEGRAPAYEAWNTTVTVGDEKDKQSVNVPKFSELPKHPIIEVGGERPSAFTGKRKIALGVGAAGVVAAVVGTVLYTRASSTYDDAKAATTNAARDRLYDDANGTYRIAQIGWGVGLAAVSAAAVLWITGGPSAPAESTAPVAAAEPGMTIAPHVGAGAAGILMRGRF